MIDDARVSAVVPVAPIAAGQVSGLLSTRVAGAEGNLFASVEPQRCAAVAREVDPPLLALAQPVATDGGHWDTGGGSGGVYVEEMVAVYRADFDPDDALAQARQTVRSCRDTPVSVTTMKDRTYTFAVRPLPESVRGGVLWSLKAPEWSCDNAFVAAHNAAIEITSCGAAGGTDIASAAADALKRIQALANATA